MRFDAALSNMVQGLVMYDGSEVLVVANRRFCEIYDLPPEQVRPGMRFIDVLQLYKTQGNFPDRTVEDVHRERMEWIARRNRGVFLDRPSTGRIVAIMVGPLPDGGWVSTFEDITERHLADEQIAFLATHDALTRLPNRVMLRERLDQGLAEARHGRQLAVLMLDLDRFKAVNDTLGHLAGDYLLQLVAERLRACVHGRDMVVRLGGDEFAIVMGPATHQDATQLAHRIVDRLGVPHDLHGQHAVVGASVGVAMAPGDGMMPATVLKHADMALYRAKADGRGVVRFFGPDVTVEATQPTQV